MTFPSFAHHVSIGQRETDDSGSSGGSSSVAEEDRTTGIQSFALEATIWQNLPDQGPPDGHLPKIEGRDTRMAFRISLDGAGS
jgi:hypothetical protein